MGKEILPLSQLHTHIQEVHGLVIEQPTPQEVATPQGLAQRAEIYSRNKAMHDRVHGGTTLQLAAGTPEHIHQPFVPTHK